MAQPRAIVIRAAGSNCDRETEFALDQAGFDASRLHINRITESPEILEDCQFLVVPGGFTYGDDVAAGKILAARMARKLSDHLNRFVDAGKLILGICNGFQVLIKSGLLPWGRVDPARPHRDATLTWNDCGRFLNRWVYLRADSDKCVFLNKGEVITLPIAHGEGKFVTRDDATLRQIIDSDQDALRYSDPPEPRANYIVNPNGSVDDLAGICDPTGRVLGLMPHPERFVSISHHPRWTRRRPERADGSLVFQNAFRYLA
jgi:phosphoribosylformylglycinamidine synthase